MFVFSIMTACSTPFSVSRTCVDVIGSMIWLPIRFMCDLLNIEKFNSPRDLWWLYSMLKKYFLMSESEHFMTLNHNNN